MHRAHHSFWNVSGRWVGGISDTSALSPENVAIFSLGEVSNPIFFLGGLCHHGKEYPGHWCTLLVWCYSLPLQSCASRWLLGLSSECVCLPLECSLSHFIAAASHADFWRHMYHCVCCHLIKAPSRDSREMSFCSQFWYRIVTKQPNLTILIYRLTSAVSVDRRNLSLDNLPLPTFL